MFRNTIAILLGLLVAFIIITTGVTINKSVFFPEMGENQIDNWKELYTNWRFAVTHASDKFFIALLVSAGLGAMTGGVITALVVKTAKQAYAVLIGFVLTIVAWFDIFFTPGHPTWYTVLLVVVLFFFSWLGAKIVSVTIKGK